VLVPYETCVVAGTFVVQETAIVEVVGLSARFSIVGSVTVVVEVGGVEVDKESPNFFKIPGGIFLQFEIIVLVLCVVEVLVEISA
jgi:hypothetical protein